MFSSSCRHGNNYLFMSILLYIQAPFMFTHKSLGLIYIRGEQGMKIIRPQFAQRDTVNVNN